MQITLSLICLSIISAVNLLVPVDSLNAMNRSTPDLIMNCPGPSRETFSLVDFASSQRIYNANPPELIGDSEKRRVARFIAGSLRRVSFRVLGPGQRRALEIGDKGRPRVRVHGAKAPKELIGRVPNSRSVGFTEHTRLSFLLLPPRRAGRLSSASSPSSKSSSSSPLSTSTSGGDEGDREPRRPKSG